MWTAISPPQSVSTTDDLPICHTMAKVGENFLPDVSLNEYMCVHSGTDKRGQFCGVAKVARLTRFSPCCRPDNQ